MAQKSYRVGISLGDHITELSYMENGKINAFTYPFCLNGPSIPTCISYDKSLRVSAVGKQAHNSLSNNKLFIDQLVSRFQSLCKNENYESQDEISPQKALRDFLLEILSSFQKEIGDIEGFVISLSHKFYTNHRFCQAIRELCIKIISVPLVNIVSVHTAVSAYLKWNGIITENVIFIATLGDCHDEVSLCSFGTEGVVNHIVSPLPIEVGKHIDRTLAKSNNDDMPYDAWNVFNARIADPAETEKRLILAYEDPRLRSLNVFKENTLGYTCGDMFNILKECGQKMDEAIVPLLEFITNNTLNVHTFCFTGTAAELLPVRRQILKHFDMKYTEIFLKDRDKLLYPNAASAGTAIIAEDLISVEKTLDMTLGFVFKRITDDRNKSIQEEFAPVIISGRQIGEYGRVSFYQSPVNVSHEEVELYCESDLAVKKRCVISGVSIPDDENEKRCYVGLQIDREKNITLWLKNMENGISMNMPVERLL